MFQRLVSHNDDFRRLVEKGYAVAFASGYLIVRDIPYLDSAGQLKHGAFVAKLKQVDSERYEQDDHQVYFAGSEPYNLDGTRVPNLGGGPTGLALGEGFADVVVERSFSSKPRVQGRYEDHFDKIETYTAMISGPACEKYPGVTPYTFRSPPDLPADPVFKFTDTLTSRAEIVDLAAKFNQDVVAVIGLGGTGAYVVDFLVKTPVKEIRGFDLDRFHVHNAFRAPGRLDPDELGMTKADVYQRRYENFRNGLSAEAAFIDASSSAELDGVTFAFVCVDKGSSRAGVLDVLIARKIPFIDVGMGLKRRKDGTLNGMIRVTSFSPDAAGRIRDMGLVELSDQPEDLYRTNVQIAELNALNAALAVIRFKQLRGFYHVDRPYYQNIFEITDLSVVGACEDEDV